MQDFALGAGLALEVVDVLEADRRRCDSLLQARATASGYYGRALAYAVGSQKSLALKDIDQAISLDPRNALYKTMRSRIAG